MTQVRERKCLLGHSMTVFSLLCSFLSTGHSSQVSTLMTAAYSKFCRHRELFMGIFSSSFFSNQSKTLSLTYHFHSFLLRFLPVLDSAASHVTTRDRVYILLMLPNSYVMLVILCLVTAGKENKMSSSRLFARFKAKLRVI